MDAYKVWSMRCDKQRSEYHLEYEARVSAHSRDEAVRMVKVRFDRDTGGYPAAGINWMAIKLP